MINNQPSSIDWNHIIVEKMMVQEPFTLARYLNLVFYFKLSSFISLQTLPLSHSHSSSTRRITKLACSDNHFLCSSQWTKSTVFSCHCCVGLTILPYYRLLDGPHIYLVVSRYSSCIIRQSRAPMPVNSASLRLSLNSQSVTSSFGEPLSSTLGHNRHTAVSSFVFFDA